MGNAFLSHIREVDAIVQVLRHFGDADISHVHGDVNPLRDKDVVTTELILSDMEQLEKKLQNLQKKAKSKDKEALAHIALLQKVVAVLEEGKMAYTLREDLQEQEEMLLRGYQLLTYKPFVYALNVSQDNLVNSELIRTEYADALE